MQIQLPNPTNGVDPNTPSGADTPMTESSSFTSDVIDFSVVMATTLDGTVPILSGDKITMETSSIIIVDSEQSNSEPLRSKNDDVMEFENRTFVEADLNPSIKVPSSNGRFSVWTDNKGINAEISGAPRSPESNVELSPPILGGQTNARLIGEAPQLDHALNALIQEENPNVAESKPSNFKSAVELAFQPQKSSSAVATQIPKAGGSEQLLAQKGYVGEMRSTLREVGLINSPPTNTLGPLIDGSDNWRLPESSRVAPILTELPKVSTSDSKINLIELINPASKTAKATLPLSPQNVAVEPGHRSRYSLRLDPSQNKQDRDVSDPRMIIKADGAIPGEGPKFTQVPSQQQADPLVTLAENRNAQLVGETQAENTGLRVDFLSETKSNPQNPSLSQIARPELAAPVARQITDAIHARITAEKVIEVSLHPAELGRLKLSVTPAENGLIVHILAEKTETLELMRRNISDLEQAFSDTNQEIISFTFDGGTAFADKEFQDNSSQEAVPEESVVPLIRPQGDTSILQKVSNQTSGIDIRV